ncbi:DUF689-domain-containing protein [Punctularia strigosozonata HHB-11173 SS5]|uniref:DUF689-domain-containing protein n=1 Tax=Punctularia strigosozonata (strain HHB-11173) TaxID=741275 RepID=UPI00044170FB|nr:DUF689-domain-containing protein [Punctularia strigosozonata HHB-11173 SS5]EIN10285.1 DUF689-domain-containing protein [Punctularia strigosozonata HHB-11173 SS5]
MAPTAIYSATPVGEPHKVVAAIPTKGPALAIGSPATAQDGKYQTLVTELQGSREVEKQMLDRLIDSATTLAPNTYASVHVVLSEPDYESLRPKLPSLLSQLLAGLSPLGTLHLLNITSALSYMPSELTLAGFNVLSSLTAESGTVIAQKPAHSVGAASSLKGPAASSMPAAPAVALLRKKPVDPSKAATKKALWSLSAPAAPSIDPESLLTAADREKPAAACEPVTGSSGKPRRKKACKNCTCGLAELEEEELRNSKVVVLDGAEGGQTSEVAREEKERLAKAAAAAPKATSSCGNCYLGDAFRCASCPYLGLPAFKPGEKVEIDFGMDDV